MHHVGDNVLQPPSFDWTDIDRLLRGIGEQCGIVHGLIEGATERCYPFGGDAWGDGHCPSDGGQG